MLDVAAGVVAMVFVVAMFLAHPVWVPETGWWRAVDAGGGVLAAAMVFVHRRSPVPLSCAIALLTAVANPAGGTALLATFLVGVRLPGTVAARIAVACAAAVPVQYVLRAEDFSGLELVRTVLVAAGVTGAMLAGGAMLRIRAELAESMAQRAERAEAAAVSGVLAARHAERAKIAREMHDVLAQRISQLSMQAGSLTHRRALEADELRDGLDAIRSAAHDALGDLRDILGVLRDPAMPDAAGDRFRPQPSVADLEPLLDSMRDAGVVINARYEVDQPERMSALCGRTLYRVSQEALTNAVKHAPGLPVEWSLVARPGSPATLTVGNPLPEGGPATPGPGTRSGLIGVRERVALAGGSVLRCGPTPDGSPSRFEIEVEIPWPR